MYEGKEYDFVFNVDTDDNSKPIKLPYNVNEDPWHVAQRFIHQHQLPQDYLSNVANFIITNTKGSLLTLFEKAINVLKCVQARL